MVTVESNKIPEVAQAIADIEGVSEVYSVAGDVDLIAVVRVREFDQVADAPRHDVGRARDEALAPARRAERRRNVAPHRRLLRDDESHGAERGLLAVSC